MISPDDFSERSRRIAAAAAQQKALAPGRRTSHDSEMEARLAAVETGVEHIKVVLGRLEPMIVRMDERSRDMVTRGEFAEMTAAVDKRATSAETRALAIDLADVKGRIALLPSAWSVFGFNVGLVALVATIFGGAIAILRFAG